MYPDYIMTCVRQNLGLEARDTSLDEKIMKMTKSEVFDRVCEWGGLIHYGSTIEQWIEDIYNIELPD